MAITEEGMQETRRTTRKGNYMPVRCTVIPAVIQYFRADKEMKSEK